MCIGSVPASEPTMGPTSALANTSSRVIGSRFEVPVQRETAEAQEGAGRCWDPLPRPQPPRPSWRALFVHSSFIGKSGFASSRSPHWSHHHGGASISRDRIVGGPWWFPVLRTCAGSCASRWTWWSGFRGHCGAWLMDMRNTLPVAPEQRPPLTQRPTHRPRRGVSRMPSGWTRPD